MVCLGLEPGAAGWKAQMNPLSYGGTPHPQQCYIRHFFAYIIDDKSSTVEKIQNHWNAPDTFDPKSTVKSYAIKRWFQAKPTHRLTQLTQWQKKSCKTLSLLSAVQPWQSHVLKSCAPLPVSLFLAFHFKMIQPRPLSDLFTLNFSTHFTDKM